MSQENSLLTGKNERFEAVSSCCGYRWVVHSPDVGAVREMVQQHRIPELVARLLASRGVTAGDAAKFLDPALKHWLPDPSLLTDMDVATERVAGAIIGGETIGIFGDYDVDGATSTALLLRFLRAVGAKAEYYIPDRMKEGYGPNIDAFMQLKERGCTVIITVDCGSVAFAPIAAAKEAGVDVVVVDHHLSEPTLPEAYAVVNPNRFDELPEVNKALGHLAAVGVAFLLCVSVQRQLRARGWYNERSAPDLLQWLDLVALGTVCDVVSLTGLNRAYVAQGLKVMSARRNIGLAALADIATLDSAPGVYHTGFILGPRINAGGRVGRSDLGTRALSTEDVLEAHALAQELDQYNAERKAIEAGVLEEAISQVERALLAPDGNKKPLLFVVGQGWHQGVIGIVAGRLKERYYRPVAVLAVEGGIAKASARSIPGVDFGAAVNAARSLGLLLAGGGHAMAAGFTVVEDRIAELEAFLAERMAAKVQEVGSLPPLLLDGFLSPSALTAELAKALEKAGPFGTGHASPRFVLDRCKLWRVDPVGKDHLRLIITEAEGGGRASGTRIKAMAFRAVGTKLGDMLICSQGRVMHLAGQVRLNRWNGEETAEFTVEDAALL